MKKSFCTILMALAAYACIAQELAAYRSAKNSFYWKNRKPDAAYWQQDVYYKINATINEDEHTISANQLLEYWNNSPDTLHFVYFHLFQNAFVKNSYLHRLEEQKHVKARLGKYEAAGLGTQVFDLKVGGKPTKVELDNTVMKVYLPQPLYPNSSVTFTMDFKTYWDNGSTRRRMKMYDAWGFKHYNGVQWFPKICVYDRKFGWDTYQHLNKEFYGDFGVYDVSLNFPSNYIVEATGVLSNKAEVLPDDLRQRLDLKNFADKPWNQPPSNIIPYVKGERKTWRYHAENVHDFAFTADPSYRIATTYWNGIECVGIAQEPHAAGWQNSADYVAAIIRTFSEDIGMYAYPKMVAADAADGMEYPMITLDGGADPGYRGLLVHETAHNWFYGMVGSNETYRAALDEGFTQFLTAWGLERIDGPYLKQTLPRSSFRKKFFEPVKARDARVFNPYIYTVLQGESKPLNTHSNDFNDALGHEGGYGMVYYKTATMLYNLQYTLGDSLFLAAFRNYFEQWKFAHPYFEDFRNSIIHFTNTDLNWFFDQWLETTKKIDYSVKGARKIRGTDSVKISFERKGEMQMPIDFTVVDKRGQKQTYHIPNTWFVKETKATVLPKWYGWGKINPSYTATIFAPAGAKHILIDTSGRLADAYQLNNSWTSGSLLRPLSWKVQPNPGLNRSLDRKHYLLELRPDVWWNSVDGLKLGIHGEGNYMKTMHRVDASFWWNSHILQGDDYLSLKSEGWYDRYLPFNFSLNYLSPVSLQHPDHEEEFHIRFLDGLWYARLGHNWKLNEHILARFYFQAFYRPHSFDLDYLLYPREWSSNQRRPNNSINIELTRTYKRFRSFGSATLFFRAPLLAGNEPDAFNYSYVQLQHLHHLYLGKLEVRSRLFVRLGMGTHIPYESALWIAGANPEGLMDNKYTRSVGFVPTDWLGISRYETNHFHMGGGLNLRGYAGYFVADEKNNQLLIGYKGRSGTALNVEVDVDSYISLAPRLTRNWLHVDLYGFADAGIIEMSQLKNIAAYQDATPTDTWSDFRMDAGVGLAFTVKNWGVFEKAKPLTLRFDMPLFLNRPPYGNPQYFNFRYVVGVERAF